jgi:hypothetical protein
MFEAQQDQPRGKYAYKAPLSRLFELLVRLYMSAARNLRKNHFHVAKSMRFSFPRVSTMSVLDGGDLFVLRLRSKGAYAFRRCQASGFFPLGPR